MKTKLASEIILGVYNKFKKTGQDLYKA